MRPYYIVYRKSKAYKIAIVKYLLSKGGELDYLDIDDVANHKIVIIFVDETNQIDAFSYWGTSGQTVTEHIKNLIDNTDNNQLIGCTRATLDNNFLKNFE